MKKRILIVVGILIAAGAIGAGSWFYFKGNGTVTADGEVVYVSTVSAITGSTSGVENRFAGVVEPQQTVEIKVDSGRKVKEVKVKTGDEVKKGQLLFEYDLSSIQEDLKQAQLDLDRLKNEALSLAEQITTLEAEKKKASADSQLSYTIEIETNKMNLRKNEYDQKSKTAQIEKLQSATGNTQVRSEIDGVIQKIDTSKMGSDDSEAVSDSMDDDYMSVDSTGSDDSTGSGAFITILSTGAYRIKGTVNEQNMNSIIEGEPVIVRSRVDENLVWKGTMGAIDQDNANTENSSDMYFGMMDSSSDSQTTSTSYPFYVDLESSDGLMLGQHVYIERDEGQEDKKDGLWLSDYYIVDADKEDPYVWASTDKNKLEKRYVILGSYDDELGEYEIVDGLTTKDSIAFPTEALQEGVTTVAGDLSQTLNSGMSADDEEYSEEEPVDMETSDEVDGAYDAEGVPYDDELTEDTEMETVEGFADDDLVPVEEDSEEVTQE